MTGANQGLGLAVAARLRARLTGPDDVVYLTGREPDRVATSAAGLAAAGLDVATHPLDVTDPGAVDRFAAMLRERHGGIDLLVSNAAARIVPDRPPAAQVREFAATNNLGTTRLLRAVVPLLRPGARLLVVASSFGTLRSLPPPLHARFDDPDLTLDGVDAVVRAWVDAVEGGTAAADGWPERINIPSKVGQVAALRVVARSLREDGPPGVLAVAVCPGLVDTAASRPWFDDMTEAQSPDEAATHLVRLALDPVDAGLHGELVQFCRVLPWR